MSFNNGRMVADIRHPKEGKPEHRQTKKPKKKGLSVSKRLAILFLFIVLVVASVLFTVNIRNSAKNIYRSFKDLTGNVSNFGGLGFEISLDSIEQDLDDLGRKAQFLSLAPQLKEIPGAIGDLKEIISVVANLGRVFSGLREDGLSLAFDGRGEELIGALKLMRFDLNRLKEVSDSLVERVNSISSYGKEVASLGEQLIDLENRLDVLINFLDVPEKKNLVILFENPSELRPSGGFAGSYGVLVLERGGIENLEVNDIYYPDKFLKKKIIPPFQLQGITPNWGARDTNWFFDFADSSKKLLEYLEASEVYQKDSIRFDGVIALNVRVVEDILRLTGPIDIPEYGMSLNSNNFLREIQEQVVADRVPGENPKEVLKFAVPALIDALGKLDGEKKGGLIDVFMAHAKSKDIKFYFRDSSMEEMVVDMGSGGRDYELPKDFTGDYLAVVNANVAGGKTDVFVDQNVTLESTIDANGVVQNKLLITRRHRGGSEPEVFYNQTNQNFLRIFTLPGIILDYIEGGTRKDVKPLVTYVGSEYVKDQDLSELEETRTLLATPVDGYVERYTYSGKRIFGTWFNLEPGESKSLEFRYGGQRVSLVDGQKYKFVLDKQSGSEMQFEYSIVAPEGFVWSETGNARFQYRERVLPARIEIDLTLKKK
ncbi:DUF4012 domain-containing protein [Patescibacteria group bacterium]|nr:DUF4012 domain-containing protein [Patescibacteria group bacterium]